MRQAYDYWQNQPGSYLAAGCRSTQPAASRERGGPGLHRNRRRAGCLQQRQPPPARQVSPPKARAAAPDVPRGMAPGSRSSGMKEVRARPSAPERTGRGDSPDGLRQAVAIGQQSGTSTGAVRRIARTTELKSPGRAVHERQPRKHTHQSPEQGNQEFECAVR